VICDQGIPMVSPSNTRRGADAPDRPAGHFWLRARTAWNDQVQAAVAARFARQMGIEAAAPSATDSPYSTQLQQAFAQEFRKLGATIPAQELVSS